MRHKVDEINEEKKESLHEKFASNTNLSLLDNRGERYSSLMRHILQTKCLSERIIVYEKDNLE